MALTKEQQLAVNQYAAAINRRNREHGGRVAVSLDNETLGDFAGLLVRVPPPPENLSPEQAAQYQAAVQDILSSTFETGVRNAPSIAESIADFAEYQQQAINQITEDFSTLANPEASAGERQNATQSIRTLAKPRTGDVKDPNSTFANYRANGDSYFNTGQYTADIPPAQRQEALIEAAQGFQGIPTQLNPSDYYRTPGAQQLINQARQDRANIQYNPTPQAQASYAPAASQWQTAYAPAAAQWQAAQAGAAAQWQAAQVAATELAALEALRDPASSYAQLGARQIWNDELIDSTPVDMVFSEWEDPEYLASISTKGTEALEQGIDYFQELVANDGRDAVSEAYFHAKQQEAEQLRRSTIQAALRDLDARGMAGSGSELQANIQGANQSMKSQFDAAMQAAAIAQQRKDHAAQMQADLGKAHRMMAFGEAATIDDALRQIRMARGQLEFATQENNTGKMFSSREAHQRFLEDETMMRNDFLNNAALQEQHLGTNVNMFNADQMNTTNRFNVGQANQVGMFNTDQVNLTNRFNVGQANQVGMFNTGEWNDRAEFNVGQRNQVGMFNTDQTNLTNRFNTGEANRVGMFNTDQANLTSRFNVGEQNRVGISNAALRAAEAGAQNRYMESGIMSDYDLLAQSLFADMGAKQQIDEGNFGRQLSTHQGYLTGLNDAEGLRIGAYNAVTSRYPRPPTTEEVAFGLGGAAIGAGGQIIGAWAGKG